MKIDAMFKLKMSDESFISLLLLPALLLPVFFTNPFMLSHFAAAIDMRIKQLSIWMSLVAIISVTTIYINFCKGFNTAGNRLFILTLLQPLGLIFLILALSFVSSSTLVVALFCSSLGTAQGAFVNRQIHLETNNPLQVSRIISLALVISSLMSALGPFIGALIISKYGLHSLVIFSLLAMLTYLAFIARRASKRSFQKINLTAGKSYKSDLNVVHHYWSLCLVSLLFAIAYFGTLLLVPSLLAGIEGSEFKIAFFFGLISFVMIFLSMPLARLFEAFPAPLNIAFSIILRIASILAVVIDTSFFMLAFSAVAFAFCESLFLPNLIRYIALLADKNPLNRIMAVLTSGVAPIFAPLLSLSFVSFPKTSSFFFFSALIVAVVFFVFKTDLKKTD